MTDELLARRILALEERIERVETSGPSAVKMILDAIADSRRDTADRFEAMELRFEQRFDAIDHRLDGVEHRLDGVEHRLDGVEHRLDGVEHRLGTLEGEVRQVIALVGGLPGPGKPPRQ